MTKARSVDTRIWWRRYSVGPCDGKMQKMHPSGVSPAPRMYSARQGAQSRSIYGTARSPPLRGLRPLRGVARSVARLAPLGSLMYAILLGLRLQVLELVAHHVAERG